MDGLLQRRMAGTFHLQKTPKTMYKSFTNTLLAGIAAVILSFITVSCSKWETPAPQPTPAGLDNLYTLYPCSSPQPSYRILFLPAGFTEKDLGENGPFIEAASRTLDIILNTYPLTLYSGQILAQAAPVPSQQSGIGHLPGGSNVPGVFLSANYPDPKSMSVEIDYPEAVAYRQAYLHGEADPEHCLVIVICHSEEDFGTCYRSITPSSKSAVAVLPTGNAYFEGIVRHEVIGHGFGFLADEYVLPENRDVVPDSETIRKIRERQKMGAALNILVEGDSPDPGHCLLENDPLTLYEGAFYYGKGILRYSENSVIRDQRTTTAFNLMSIRILEQRCREIFND